MPKIIGNTRYYHKSASYSIGNDRVRINQAIKKIDNFNWDIVSVSKDKISFLCVPSFDSDYEPSIKSRISVNNHMEASTLIESIHNPRILHRRYLFVDGPYDGFNVNMDMERAHVWSSLKPTVTKMGRRVWWDQWLKSQKSSVMLCTRRSQ